MAEGSICRNCFHSYVCEKFNENKDDDNKKCHFFNDHFVPTADVVGVVRCEECKCLMKEIVVEQTPYGFENEKIEFGCQRILDLTGEWVDVMLDDFCSYGERNKCDG